MTDEMWSCLIAKKTVLIEDQDQERIIDKSDNRLGFVKPHLTIRFEYSTERSNRYKKYLLKLFAHFPAVVHNLL